MTTARDEVVEAMAASMYGKNWNSNDPQKRPGDKMKDVWRKYAADALAGALSAPESVRLDLVALLNPWRPIETAPRNGTMILAAVDWLPYAKVLFWASYANEWRCPATENAHKYEPTLWKPLDLPPHCKLLPAPPSEDVK